MSKHIEIVREYFRAQNDGDADAVVKLFADDAVVINAANPAVQGQAGVRAFVEGLHARTLSRQFKVLRVFENENAVAAEWEVEMIFREGAVIGPHTLAKSFTLHVKGVNVFEFTSTSSAITALRIYHETSTGSRLASEHSTTQ